jgi:RimJ/RimL family protein N-acetyltransferase
MITIETQRLILRNFKMNDWEALHEMIVQYAASEYAAYDQPWPTSVEEMKGINLGASPEPFLPPQAAGYGTRKGIKGITEWFASGGNFLAACLKDTGQLIGFVALNPEESSGENNRAYNLGYVFNANYHGRGYATEACKAMLNQALGQLQALRVITGTAAVNRNSRRLLERLGFRKTGEKISSFKTGADGKPIEFLGYSYAISKAEWENR